MERLVLNEVLRQSAEVQELRDDNLATRIINRLAESVNGGK